MLLVQQYLLTHSLQQLELEHGVNHRFSADRSKFSLNYDQISAKSTDPLANQCRGLILRPESLVSGAESVVGPTNVMMRPMDRFFNADDPVAAPINWATARIQNKLDGTCAMLYYDSAKDQWCVATRSVSEADVCFGDIPSPLKNNTFYELFMYSAQSTLDYMANSRGSKTVDYWLSLLDKSFTYIFELTTPINRVVVKYDDYRITLLCARETATGTYMHYEGLHEIGVPVVNEWPLKTLQDIEDFLLHSDPAKVEGAVVVDSQNNRIKVKSKAWVLASRAKDSVTMSKRNALEVIINGQLDDILPLLDQGVSDYLRRMQSELGKYLVTLDTHFNRYKSQPDRKSFALNVQASGLWQSPFFNLYSGKWNSTSEWLQYLSREKKLTDSTLDVILAALVEQMSFVEP